MNLLLITAASIHAQRSVMEQHKIDSLKNIPIRLIEPNSYMLNLAFFCKKELQIEKITKIPFKFRLGSLEYVDRLESKHQSPIQKSRIAY